MPSEIGGGSEQIPLLCRPFWWPWWGVETIHAASPNAACLWLHWKPLDAVIGWLLASYRLGGHQGDSKQNNDVLCTHFDGHFDGHRDAAVLYRVHRPMEEVQGFHIKPLNAAIGRALAPIAVLRSSQCCYLAWCFRCDGDFAAIWREGLGGWFGILISGF
jgi:hypothetical protein